MNVTGSKVSFANSSNFFTTGSEHIGLPELSCGCCTVLISGFPAMCAANFLNGPLYSNPVNAGSGSSHSRFLIDALGALGAAVVCGEVCVWGGAAAVAG